MKYGNDWKTHYVLQAILKYDCRNKEINYLNLLDMKLEEIAKMSWDEFHDYLNNANEDADTLENPIAEMTTLKEIDEYLASIGALSWGEALERISDRLDNI